MRYQQHAGIHAKKIGQTWVMLLASKKEVVELNETAGVLWEALLHPRSTEELSKLTISLYSVDKQQAKKDIEEFIDFCLQHGFVRQVG